MFSLENFYYIVYNNLLKPANIIPAYYYPFGSTQERDILLGFASMFRPDSFHFKHCLFHDQEPFVNSTFNFSFPASNKYLKILANSEISMAKSKICKAENYLDWYYFYHGFAALAWYRDYKYLPMIDDAPKKMFISLNRLVTNDRSYRLTLVSQILETRIIDQGIVSLSLYDHGYGTWQEELAHPQSKLSPTSKTLIERNIGKLSKSLVVDYTVPQGSLSADAGPKELLLNQSALWHVVPETVFYYDKLHLTEKVFKPIVSRRPFLLVAAPGNLAYLKSYGFKTFDRWIDESYDLETNDDRRIEMIIKELENLCSMSDREMRDMHDSMKEILDFNFNHFYGDFKELIVREMLENFQHVVHQWNHARVDGKDVNIDDINFAEVEKILLS